MKCTLFRLYPLVIGISVCGGESVTIKELSKISAINFLDSLKCYKKGTNYSMAEVILNKLTPEQQINLGKISDLDICESHKNYLTKYHKSVRQKTCAVETCNSLGESDKSRISFEMSFAAYQRLGLHITVGSTVCSGHRKQINKSQTQIPITCSVQSAGSGPNQHASCVPTVPSESNLSTLTSCVPIVPTESTLQTASSLPKVSPSYSHQAHGTVPSSLLNITQVTSGLSINTQVTSSFI